MSACEDLKHLYVTRHRVCNKLHSGQWRRQGGREEASPLWVDVQKLCNMCVLSLSWNFFVTHDKYIARPSSKEPRWYTDNTTGTGGTSYSKPPIDPYLTSPLLQNPGGATDSGLSSYCTSADNGDIARICCWAPAVQQSVDISWPPGLQQETRNFFATNLLFNCRISCGVLLLTFMHVITSSIPSPLTLSL